MTNKNIEKAKEVWEELEDTSLDENECIENDVAHFEIGTDVNEIHVWIEEEFNVAIAIDILGL